MSHFAKVKATLLASMVFSLAVFAQLSGNAYAQVAHAGYSSVEMVAEKSSVSPGQVISFGLRLKPQKTWHTYWVNPGDAGKSIRVNWGDKGDLVIGPMQLPAPHLIPFMGMVSYGYDEDILVIFDVEIPKRAKIGSVIHLSGAANWLVCDDKSCVPQDAEISYDLLVGKANEDNKDVGLTQEFAIARSKFPIPVDWKAVYSPYGDGQVLFHIDMEAIESGYDNILLYPVAKKIIDHATTRQVQLKRGGLAFVAKAGKRVQKTAQSDLVIVVQKTGGVQQAYIVKADTGDLAESIITKKFPLASENPSHFVSGGENNVGMQEGDLQGGGLAKLLGAVVFAILGGLLLNLMPCVMPILSLKALGLAKLSGENLRTAQVNGLVYTAGILASFLLFAIILVALRSAGGMTGWGFQMQQPVVLVVLALLLGAIGANLAGMFEFSSRLSGVGQGLTHGNGYKSEFFTGVLAVVVASPCTAPFMGGALGYALTQPLIITILVFLALGFGLALPYLLLCFFPVLRKWMPKPGAWMNSFKQFLAFPMFVTALWILWILGNQVGLGYVLGVLLLALFLSMALWAWGKRNQSSKKMLWLVFCLVALGGSGWVASVLPGLKESPTASLTPDGLHAEPYSLAGLEALLASDEKVFVYFTADWCITCKVNEKAALHKPEVIAAFKEKNIKVMVGDWTNSDDEIAKILQRFGRVGVPLYLYYTPGMDVDDAKVLPQILTPKNVINAL
ncbi:MAG: thioredoxin family protein [Robiginitomaculum sp.]